jgi:hypothetical protein
MGNPWNVVTHPYRKVPDHSSGVGGSRRVIKVKIECLGQRRGAATVARIENSDDPDALSLDESQDIAGRDAMARFTAMLAVQAQMPLFDHFGSHISGFEETGDDQPFVQPLFRLDVLDWLA